VGLRSLQAVKNWPAGVLSTMGSASSSQAKVNSPGMSESPDIPGRFSPLSRPNYRAATCFLPYTRSIIAVSPYSSARTVLPSRRVYTSAS
jgi:hypothetical protein